MIYPRELTDEQLKEIMELARLSFERWCEAKKYRASPHVPHEYESHLDDKPRERADK